MGKFKQQFTNVPGITDGVYDIGTILEDNTKNVDQADVLNQYLENGTRLSTKYYSTKNINHFTSSVKDASPYIKYKRNGYNGLVGLGYYPIAKELFKVVNNSRTSSLSYTLKTDSSGNLMIDNTELKLTRLDGTKYSPKIITLVVQAAGGSGAPGKNEASSSGIAGGGGGAGECAIFELCLSSDFKKQLPVSTTFATITLGKGATQRTTVTDTSIYSGGDCTVSINGQTIIVGGGLGGGLIDTAEYEYDRRYGGANGTTKTQDQQVQLTNTLIGYDSYGLGGTGGYQHTKGDDAEHTVAYSASQSITNFDASYDGGIPYASGSNGFKGGGGEASLFSNGFNGYSDQTTEAQHANNIADIRIGCGGGGGAQFLYITIGSTNTDRRYLGCPGGYSALYIYY